MSRKCAKCGTVSEIEEAFQKAYYSDKIFFCPQCWQKNLYFYGQSYLKACIAVLIVGSIWTVADIENELAWLIFQLGLAACFTIVLVLPHELGHVLAALISKGKILRVTIGLGKTLYSNEIWGIEWKFCAIPVCGFPIICFYNKKFYRTRRFLTSLGGPFINCLFIVPAAILLLHVSSPLASAFLKSFIAANIFEIFYNLYPTEVNMGDIIVRSDGLSLIKIPFMTESMIDQEILRYYIWQGDECFRKCRYEDAKCIYEKALIRFPDSSPEIQYQIGTVLLHSGNYNEARNLFVELQKNTTLSPVIRMNILNSIAYADYMTGWTFLLEEADAYSKTASEAMPWQMDFKWTRGLVLMSKGQTEKGLTLLKEVIDKTQDPLQKAEYTAYIACCDNKNSTAIPPAKYSIINYR